MSEKCYQYGDILYLVQVTDSGRSAGNWLSRSACPLNIPGDFQSHTAMGYPSFGVNIVLIHCDLGWDKEHQGSTKKLMLFCTHYMPFTLLSVYEASSLQPQHLLFHLQAVKLKLRETR